MSLSTLAAVQVLSDTLRASTLRILAVLPLCIRPPITINASSHCNDEFYNNGP